MHCFDWEIARTLRFAGFSNTSGGYNYICDYLAMRLGGVFTGTAEKAYDEIAVKRRTTSSAVKSGIRFCVDRANENGLVSNLNTLFGYEMVSVYPSSKQALSYLEEYLSLKRSEKKIAGVAR